MLTDSAIKYLAATPAVYERGLKYWRDGRVIELEKENAFWVAIVKGNYDEYAVAVEIKNDLLNRYRCDCAAFRSMDGICKHIVAVLKKIQETSADAVASSEDAKCERMLKAYRLRFDERTAREAPLVQVEVRFCCKREHYRQNTAWLELKTGLDKLYSVRNIGNFLDEYLDGKKIVVQDMVYQPTDYCLSPAYISLIDFLAAIRADEREWENGADFFRANTLPSLFSGKKMRLLPGKMADFFSLMEKHSLPFSLSVEEKNFPEQLICDCFEPYDMTLAVEKTPEEKAVWKFDHEEPPLLLTKDASYIVRLSVGVIHVPAEIRPDICRLVAAFADEKSDRDCQIVRKLFFPKEKIADFLTYVLPSLKRITSLKISPEFLSGYSTPPLLAEFLVDYEGDGITLLPRYEYGEKVYNPLTEEEPSEFFSGDSRQIIREKEKEEKIVDILAAYGFKIAARINGADDLKPPRYFLCDELDIFDFFQTGIKELEKYADIFYSESFQHRPVSKPSPITLGISLGDGGLLSVELNDDWDFAELAAVLAACREKKAYHRRRDGSFIDLSEDKTKEEISAVAKLFGEIGIVELTENLAGERQKLLPLYYSPYLAAKAQEMREEKNGTSFFRLVESLDFSNLVESLNGKVSRPVPPSLENVLRDYQKIGYNWLSTLADYEFGGILADDMGLGKTLEVLTLLLAEKSARPMPSLVVAPKSLIYNWQAEANRFTPELSVAIVAGTAAERRKKIAAVAANPPDLIVTSYPVLRRDGEKFSALSYRYVFLDEAQAIKNPLSHGARAVKRVREKAAVAFALTGTPIENNLTELWSIFDVLMPGYLGAHQAFREKYELPIVKDKEENAATELKHRIAPFILRRLKRDVLTELPEKIETCLISPMTEEQTKIYRAYLARGKKEFYEALKKNGFEGSRIEILAILTRLRQIACDPALFLDDYDGGSGKIDQLLETVPAAIAAGHRLLIFSQFTAMLDRIEMVLRDAGVPFFRLDGSTPARDRLIMVEAFNRGSESGVVDKDAETVSADNLPAVFLISLKAGGTGLNLTGADMVIHFDPWWNPAVENQATDRVHRIGQKKVVQVFRFIAKDSVEEKISILKEKKRELSEMLLSGDTVFSYFTVSDIAALFE